AQRRQGYRRGKKRDQQSTGNADNGGGNAPLQRRSQVVADQHGIDQHANIKKRRAAVTNRLVQLVGLLRVLQHDSRLLQPAPIRERRKIRGRWICNCPNALFAKNACKNNFVIRFRRNQRNLEDGFIRKHQLQKLVLQRRISQRLFEVPRALLVEGVDRSVGSQ